MFKNLVFEDFKDRVGGVFTVREEDVPPVSLTLAEATSLPARFTREGVRPPFSLIFSGSAECTLPQRLYRLLHEELGEITIFLVPVGLDAKGASYQALFN
jgi:hypothetical protein